jgi:hypothetical protein
MLRSIFLVITAAMALVSPGTCFAWLGETEEQIRERYGAPISSDENPSPPAEKVLTFLADDSSSVTVVFFNGRSACELYKFNSPRIGETDVPKIEEILAKNTRRAKWKRMTNPAASNPNIVLGWMRLDFAASASVMTEPADTLQVSDNEFSAAVSRARAR